MSSNELYGLSSTIGGSDSAAESVETVDIADGGLKIIPSKQNDRAAAGIYYTRAKKLAFTVKGLTFTNIPVLKSVRLSFYEKFAVLLLQKGVKASNLDELVDFISIMLNVSNKCIAEFVVDLKTNKSLIFDSKEHIFKLDPAVRFTLDKNRDNAMFAELDVKQADCDKIVFVNELNSLYLDEDFPKEVFARKGDATNASNTSLPSKVTDIVYSRRALLETLFVRYFNGTDMHLKRDFSYELLEDKCLDFQFEFDALIEYQYIKEQKKAIRQNVIVQNGNMLPEQFIDSLADKYNTDTTLPKFIALDEDFYQKITSCADSITDTEAAIDITNDKANLIQQEVIYKKADLRALQEEHAKAEKVETDKIDKIKKEIVDKEGDINVIEDMVSHPKADDSVALINTLKDEIKGLNAKRSELESQLSDTQKSLEELIKTHRQTEGEMNSVIKSKEAEWKVCNDSIKEYERKRKDSGSDGNDLIKKYNNKFSSIVKSVTDKYPMTENLFCIYVIDICIGLDSAVSASEYSSFDEVIRHVDGIREKYRKVLQSVFEVVLRENITTLGGYLSDPYKQIKIQYKLREKKIPLDLFNKLTTFHSLANAIGHFTENGRQKKDNKQRMADFMKLTAKERSEILLAIPTFFLKIELSKKEIDAIVAKLRVNAK